MRYLILAVVIVVLVVYFFGRSSSTNPVPARSEQLKQDLKVVGHDIKDAAKDIAAEAKPAFQNATQKGIELLHEGAQKIADHTAPSPATMPQ